MPCNKTMVLFSLLAPCDQGGGGMEAIEAAVASPARPAADVARDGSRKPAEVLAFYGIDEGMTVLEIFAGGGYYTQILDGVVGPDGKVLAHNNQGYLNFVGDQFKARFENGGLPNTEMVLGEVNDLDLAEGSLDATMLVLAWHDFLFEDLQYQWPDVDETAFLDQLCQAMKPGAVLAVIDHVAGPGGDAAMIAQTIHRIDPATVQADITGSCFDLQEESALLRNAEDDHTLNTVEGPMVGKSDRFMHKYVRR